MRRLRGDRTAEIGVFEDLQVLLVVVVGIAVLIASALYNWGAVADFDDVQSLYDAAEDLMRAFQASGRLSVTDEFGYPATPFVMNQQYLEIFKEYPDNFNGSFKSDVDYNISFEDRGGLGANATPYPNATYMFGSPIPGSGVETVTLQANFPMLMYIEVNGTVVDPAPRHVCLVTVVVWR
jgi:hypothetical protein